MSPIFLQKVLPCQRPRRYLDYMKTHEDISVLRCSQNMWTEMDRMQMLTGLTGVNSGSRLEFKGQVQREMCFEY